VRNRFNVLNEVVDEVQLRNAGNYLNAKAVKKRAN
jgi:hypothetical protein